MTLWVAWSALISAFIAIAAAASARAGAHHRAPRRFVWMGAMLASTVVPLVLALRTAPPIMPSLPSSPVPSPTVALSPSTIRVTSGRRAGSDRAAATTAQPADRPALRAPIASPRSLSGGVSRWGQWRREITTEIANVQLADAWIARGWVLTSLILFLAFVHASVVLGRRRSRWRDVETDVGHVLVARDAGPAVIGFVRPRIVIPEWALSIERATRDLLLRHELEHIRAGDSRTLLVAEVLLICAPWNAALWWMARQLRLAIEIDCDARVIRSGGRTREYALLLLAVGERYASAIPLAASLSEPRSNLEARIDAMTAPRLRRPVVASVPFVALAAAVLATSAWVPRPMPLLSGHARVPKESVARPLVVESQFAGAIRSRVPDSSISSVSITHGITTASVEGQRAINAQLHARPTSRSVEPATTETSAAEPVQGNPAPRYPDAQSLPTSQHPSPETAKVVSRDPKPLPGNPAPRYPDALRGNGTEGHVLLTFSTDARGVPDTTTINVIESTNDQFTNAVRRVLPNWRFDSAGRVRFACRFMTPETEQKEVAARTSTTFTIEGVAVLPVVVVSATPTNTKPLDAPQPIRIGAVGSSPARNQFETRAELEAQAAAAEDAHGTGEAWLLRSRLEKGDFQKGDRILVVVEGANIMTEPETLVVQNGKNGKHLGFARMADLSLEGVLRAELQDRLKRHLAQYLREPVVVRATPLVPERDHGDQQMILSKRLSAAVDTIAARLGSLEVQRLSWLAGERTSGAPQNDVELQIRLLREQLRRLPERDSVNRVVDARVAAALDARESELKSQLQQLRLVYTDNYPVVQNVARVERLVEERKAKLRRANP